MKYSCELFWWHPQLDYEKHPHRQALNKDKVYSSPKEVMQAVYDESYPSGGEPADFMLQWEVLPKKPSKTQRIGCSWKTLAGSRYQAVVYELVDYDKDQWKLCSNITEEDLPT